MITAVWSSYGHRFMETDSVHEEQCLICGARYRLVNDDPENPTHGAYQTASGEEPQECTGRTDLVHGYERHCENDNGRPCTEYGEPCEHTEHNCPCVQCA